MRVQRVATVAICLAVIAAASPAVAWDNQGHMAVGEIAYDELVRADPAVARSLAQLAMSLPRSERMRAAIAAEPPDRRDRVAFGFFARWPDDIRNSVWDRPTEHYRVRGVSWAGSMIPIRSGEAHHAYARYLATLRDPKQSARARAVALAWICHIVGDMHQPLHAGTWLSWHFPKTDRAGTTSWVRYPGQAKTIELHEFWDHAADRPGSEQAGADAIVSYAERYLPRSRLPELSRPAADFDIWADESAALAWHFAYNQGSMIPGTSQASATQVSQAYQRRMRTLADIRIATAGYRLGELLRSTPRHL